MSMSSDAMLKRLRGDAQLLSRARDLGCTHLAVRQKGIWVNVQGFRAEDPTVNHPIPVDESYVGIYFLTEFDLIPSAKMVGMATEQFPPSRMTVVFPLLEEEEMA